MFDTKADAQYAFGKLSGMFDSLSKSRKVLDRNDKIIAEYSDQPTMDEGNNVQFILTKDKLHEDKYTLFFRMGSFTYPE